MQPPPAAETSPVPSSSSSSPVAIPCVIPAAGLGLRMREAGASCKELLPVAGAPAMAHALRLAALAGCAPIVAVARPDKADLLAWLETDPLPRSLGVVIRMQPEALGEGDAILQARDLLGAGLFAVAYPDNLYSPPPEEPDCSPLSLLLEPALADDMDTIGLHSPHPDELRAYANSGRVDTSPDPGHRLGFRRIGRCYEKGPGAFMPRRPVEWRCCGLYVATPRFLEALAEARAALAPGEELTDGHGRRRLLSRGAPLQARQLPGQIYDIGTPQGYDLARCRLGE